MGLNGLRVKTKPQINKSKTSGGAILAVTLRE